jgi:hypothetical protein
LQSFWRFKVNVMLWLQLTGEMLQKEYLTMTKEVPSEVETGYSG